jgi:two-component system sensor histidine kinase/response regulator
MVLPHAHYEPLPYPIGLITLTQQLSQSIAEQNQLRTALHRAEALTAEKAQFAANISHEIRNPINAIQGLCENALEGSEVPPQEVLQKILHCAVELDKLIKDVLDFSRLESGAMILESLQFNPVLEFEKIVQRLHPMAQRKGIEFIATLNPDTPHCVQGDPTKFRRIINNLVDNATKFTARGNVTCELNLHPIAHTIHAEITVTDTGVGIPPDRLEHIFNPFTQAEASTTRRYGGSGLGLAITRKLCQAMQGDVHVTSTINQGSQFIATCVFSAVENPPAYDRPDLSGQKILIAGGNTLSRNWIAACLTFLKAETVTATCNHEAEIIWSATALSDRPFTRIILDLPTDTSPRLPPIPKEKILLLAEPGLELRGYHQLSKPITLTGLSQIFSSATQLKNTAINATIAKPAARRSLRILIAEDNEVNREVTTCRLKRAGHEVSATVDGSAALELWRSKEFDLAILDLQMPLLDGIELATSIRSEEITTRRRATRLIALTGMAENNVAQRCRNAGFDDYLTKPMRGSDLIQKIDEAMRPSAIETDEHEFISLLKQANEDEIEDLQIAGRAFLRHSDQLIEQLAAASSRANIHELTLQAHGIKGMLSLMGCQELAKLASRIEHNASSPIAKENTKQLIHGLQTLQETIRSSGLIPHGQTQA